MTILSSIQVDEIVQCCLDLYNQLPKSGKPLQAEWTVLSCILKYDVISRKYEVVSAGTGSKCIGASKMSPLGDLLNDSHAEVVARRGFLLYLYENIQKTQTSDSIFRVEGHDYILKENIEFIFYSSQLPCGDASILPKCGEEDQFGDLLLSRKRLATDEVCQTEDKKIKIEADIHRTGAKCLPHSEQDPQTAGCSYHLLGQVRTKPGRGDRTQSVSCSDKLARWVHIGIQGALLDIFCGAIFIKHFIFGGGVPYSKESLKRALLERKSPNDGSVQTGNTPHLYQSSISFHHVKKEEAVRPAPASIVWTAVTQSAEVAVQGRKLGLTKKKAILPKHSLCISKYKIYERFLTILNTNKEIKQDILGDTPVENVSYSQMKRKSKRYLENWLDVKEKFFRNWTVKPDMWNFCVNRS